VLFASRKPGCDPPCYLKNDDISSSERFFVSGTDLNMKSTPAAHTALYSQKTPAADKRGTNKA